MARKAYITASSPTDLRSAMTSAFSTLGDNVVNNSGGENSDPSMKKFHLAAFRLLCIGLDDTKDWTLPTSINPLFDTLAKKGVSHAKPRKLHEQSQ